MNWIINHDDRGEESSAWHELPACVLILPCATRGNSYEVTEGAFDLTHGLSMKGKRRVSKRFSHWPDCLDVSRCRGAVESRRR